MSGGGPRHLAASTPVHRRWTVWTGVGLAVLLLLGGVLWAGGGGGSRREPERSPAAAPPATASRSPGAVTTTTEPPSPTTTVAQASGNRPENLLSNASFEAGAQGWRPVGGAQVVRTAGGTSGSWSLRILAGPSASGPVGVTVPGAATTKPGGRYHTNAWVRPSSPGATVTIGLREYVDGRPVPGSNTLGWTVERTGWRQFGVIHPTSRAGARLDLEIMARDLPPGGYIEVDEVVLHLLGDRT